MLIAVIILQKALVFLFAVLTSLIFAVQTVKLGKKANGRRVHCFLLDTLQEFCLARVASACSGVNRQIEPLPLSCEYKCPGSGHAMAAHRTVAFECDLMLQNHSTAPVTSLVWFLRSLFSRACSQPYRKKCFLNTFPVKSIRIVTLPGLSSPFAVAQHFCTRRMAIFPRLFSTKTCPERPLVFSTSRED